MFLRVTLSPDAKIGRGEVLESSLRKGNISVTNFSTNSPAEFARALSLSFGKKDTYAFVFSEKTSARIYS